MSQSQLVPYLTFGGNCREAMTFYQQCLGGELQLHPFAEAPMVEQMPAELRQGIMHASLTTDSLVLMASDSNQLQPITPGDAITLSLNCNSREEIQERFSRLSAGGRVTMPLEDTFWNATFGMFTDKFGLPWMLNFDHAPAEQAAVSAEAAAAH
jgi:PhnB protein